MTRGILIAGNESSLFSAAAAEAAKRVESFAAALIRSRFPQPEGGSIAPGAALPAGAVIIPWNPASSISARTLVLSAENRLGQINDALVVCSPPSAFKTVEALTPEEIEILVNDHIKSWFFLVRELALYFRRQGAGSLSLIAPETISDGAGKNAQADLFAPPAAASFRAFARSVLTARANEPFLTMGFTGPEAGAEGDFAAWFFKIIDEGTGKTSGRWHSYSKLKFFR